MALSCSKKAISLLRGITSKDDGDFYSRNSLQSFRQKKELGYYKKVFEIKDFL